MLPTEFSKNLHVSLFLIMIPIRAHYYFYGYSFADIGVPFARPRLRLKNAVCLGSFKIDILIHLCDLVLPCPFERAGLFS
jgi:hypothetical protein